MRCVSLPSGDTIKASELNDKLTFCMTHYFVGPTDTVKWCLHRMGLIKKGKVTINMDDERYNDTMIRRFINQGVYD